LDEAIDLLTRTSRQLPNSIIEYNLANALAKKGLLADTEQHYRAALAMKPDFTEAHYNLALNLTKRSRFDEAVEQFETVLRLRPDLTSAWINLGAIATEQGRLNDAVNCFQSALKLQPGDSDTHFNLGKVLAAQGRFDEAARHFAEFVRRKPGDANGRREFGYALARNGRLDEAIAEFNEVVRLKPDAQAYYDLASAQELQGKAGEAATLYRQALTRDRDFLPAMNNLAWLLATHPDPGLRDGNEAVRLAERACDLTQHQEPLLVGTLAAAYAEAGRFPEAIATAQKARDLALAAGQQELADKNEQLLELYKAGKAYH
jgi:tetratricopeptide (TPR) repeat protein